MPSLKRCFKCGKEKELGLFYKHPQMGDGHLNKCKTCTKKDVYDRYHNPAIFPKIKEYEQRRFKDPERKKKIKEYASRRRSKHPQKERARRLVAQAIRKGELNRQPCERCGDQKSQAHHSDYRKPFQIKWLCFVHHRQEHGQNPQP